jgi:hypothetical protein
MKDQSDQPDEDIGRRMDAYGDTSDAEAEAARRAYYMQVALERLLEDQRHAAEQVAYWQRRCDEWTKAVWPEPDDVVDKAEAFTMLRRWRDQIPIGEETLRLELELTTPAGRA